MSRFRATSLLLAASLAACADDRLPTNPRASGAPADASTTMPRSSLAPAEGHPGSPPLDPGSASPADEFSPLLIRAIDVPFTQLSGSGTSAASATSAPHSNWILCRDKNIWTSEWKYTFPPMSNLLAAAGGIFMTWSTVERHAPKGGRTEVGGQIEFTSTTGRSRLVRLETSVHSEEFTKERVRYADWLSPEDLQVLRIAGGTIYARVRFYATAKVPDEACGKEITSAFAKIAFGHRPTLRMVFNIAQP
jgi:hypothetical protein